MPPNPGRTAVYRPRNAAGRLLYVGVAEVPEARWKQHERCTSWWHEVAGRPDVEWFATRKDALAAERRAIREERPRYNMVGTVAHARRLSKPPVGEPYWWYGMGSAEIGIRLGVSRQRVQQLVALADFPQPFEELCMGRIWATADVETWIAENRPPGMS